MAFHRNNQDDLLLPRAAVRRRLRAIGFSMVEVMVAMTLFAMAIGSLFPILVEYSRQVHRLEKCSPQCGRFDSSVNAGGTITWTLQPQDPIYHGTDPADGEFRYKKLPSHAYNAHSYPDQWHLVPADDPWMWKLGAMATLVPDAPSALTALHAPYLRPFAYTTAAASGTATSYGTASAVADNSDASVYTETTGFTWIDGPVTSTAHLNNSRRLAATGSDAAWAATWKFNNVQPGWYEVWVHWPTPTDVPMPETPNQNASTSVGYRVLDGSETNELGNTNTNSTPLSQLDLNDGSHNYAGLSWTPVPWNNSSTKPTTWVYVPLRDVPDNYTTTTDQNGHAVTIYKGDTIRVQVQVPPAASPGFITSDAVLLMTKSPNTIKREAPLTRSWTHTSGNSVRTVSGTVTVTNPYLP